MTKDVDVTIQRLKKSKGSMKAKLTQFQAYLEIAKGYKPTLSDLHSIELQNRLERIKKMFNEFDTLQNELEMLSEIPDEQYSERQIFEAQYFSLVAAAQELLDACSKKQQVQEGSEFEDPRSGESCSHSKNCFHLPKINIPQFNGDYQNWLEFRDTYISMIHKNDNLDNISKFHYLRASLHGSAAIVVQNINFTKESYETAWNLLCDRYDNSRLLVNNHVHALFNVEPISRESSQSIRHLLDVTNKNIRALTVLKQPTQHWDTLIIYMMSNKLDSVTSRYWGEFRNTLSEPPTLSQFCTFLSNRADLLENLEDKITINPENVKTKSFIIRNNESNKKYNKNNACPMCKSEHLLFSCEKFKALSIESRINKVKECKLCFNCLKPGHSNKTCTLTHCRYCKLKHNTLLHLHTNKIQNPNPASTAPIQESVALPISSIVTDTSQSTVINDIALSTNTHQHTTSSNVLLSTAVVHVLDYKGSAHKARLLLDNGSTANFITHELCSKLGLQKRETRSTISGIWTQSCDSTKSCNIIIKSLYSDYQANVNCLILPQITKALPSKLINTNHINLPTGVQLADPSFGVPSAIDILVGAETFWSVICNNSIDLGKNQPKLYETKLGWLVSGYIAGPKSSHHCHFLNQEESLSRFWELDSILPKHSLTTEERECENLFYTSTYRKDNGQFVVTMPLKKDPSELGDSYAMAKIRFLSLERKFQRDPTFKNMYLEFMREYIQLGHMTENTLNKNTSCTNYFLPHHGVIRESSTTTKLRTVFDASAVTTTGLSLNDIQMVGPTVQDDLLSILIRFRQHKFVVAGDIEKMYRAIELNPIQRSLQQIVFRDDPSQPLKMFTLNTVTYGTASAPYLATKCLSSLADSVDNDQVKMSIKRDFYVDDYLSGGNTEESVIQTCKEVISTLSSAQFNLRKFKSNSNYIIQQITNEKCDTNILNLSKTNPTVSAKTLGVCWQCDLDTLSFSININLRDKVTKRHILSVISQIFDPLGLVGPSIIEAKLIMQKLWMSKLEWDDEVPTDIKQAWLSFSSTLKYLNSIQIPRWVLYNNYIKAELHTFSDASERAYGACVYARVVCDDGSVHTSLIASKNKVAPLKPTTMPRLELCAALIAARLCTKVLTSLTLRVDCRYWCDSTIVLSWLTTASSRLKPFVRNRVNEINEATAGKAWGYVPSLENPADLVSRGVKADVISSSSMWWSGPSFLQNSEESWPKMPNSSEKRDLPEIVCHIAQNTHSTINTNPISNLVHRHSNFKRLLHSVAYVNRFIKNCKQKQNKINGNLGTKELNNALIIVLKQCQIEMFPDEYLLLKSNKQLPRKNRLLSLSPYMDSSGVIRANGRLHNSNYSYDTKHPMLLCSKHHVTKLIFRAKHIELFHASPLLLLAEIRQSYWTLGGRNLAKSIVHHCVKCIRHKAQKIQPIMGHLPTLRTELEFPFLNTSVDYAGPILIANRRGRGCKLIKSYICIFTCLAVKAVHLELVTELSAEAYLAALRRFAARRGKPQTILSDNATNFVGASNDLKSIISNPSIASNLADENINFLFTPAYSPHFNGLAEAAVRSTKYHLRRVLGMTHLTYEEMYTCLTQIEAILNSRPITPLSTDPSDYCALTPSHFLIGRTTSSVPMQTVSETANVNLLERHRRVDALKLHFWRRFTNEYITSLQQRTKWTKSNEGLQPNSLVIIRERNTPPLVWSLGRITAVYPGSDGINRVAEIKTNRGTIRRAYNNICALPTEDC